MASGNGGKKPIAIGIDLGTTYSCVAIWKHDNRVEIIANDQGKRTTPSCVAFTVTERLIGDDAKNQMSRNHANTIYDAKRLIGRRFSERIVQDGMKTWPFKVVKGRKDIPNIVVNYMGNEKQFSAVEISSMVLSKMKDIAEAYIGDTVKDAVITVPAYFNDSQRQATKDAANIVGLNVIRIINEPTAAAIAYGVDNMQSLDRNRNVLVFDLGGGTFDVSFLTIGKSGTFDVIAVAGDAHLGGQDFDNNLVNYCVKVFKEKTKIDITKNKKALGKLKSKCEKAKRYLSGATQTYIVLDSLYEGVNLSITITRALFENLNIDLFSMCINKVKSCLRDANTKKTNVDDVILVGGSTRIPKIQSMLQEFFDRKKLCKDINPDEAVAYGAAFMAAKVSGQTTKTLHDLVLHDVTPLSLGIKIHGDLMRVLIPRNTSIPTKKTELFVTTTDNQTFMKTMVYQGERAKASDNYLLGQFTISGIPLAPKGEIEVKDCFEIDANGILTVTSTIGSTGKTKKRTFTNCSGRLSKNEIKKMVEDAEKFKVRDQEYKRKVDANNDLEDCLYGLQKKMKRNDMSPMGVKYLNYVIDNTMNWLEDNKGATFDKIETTKKIMKSSKLAISN